MPEKQPERRSGRRQNFEKTSVMLSQEITNRPPWQKNILFIVGLGLILVPPIRLAMMDPELGRSWADFASGAMVMVIGGLCIFPMAMLRMADRLMRFRRKNGHG